MSDALEGFRTRNALTDQTEQADERQVQNHEGGYVFEVSELTRVKRFLMLGTDGGSYYQGERDLTKDNAKIVIDYAKANGIRLANLLLDISEGGRAPKQNPTLFALAVIFAFGDVPAKHAARVVFNRIVRTGTHLFLFTKYVEQFRGWGPSVQKAVAGWYLEKDPKALSYQLVKYRQREGWTHRDVLRVSHPKTTDATKKALFSWTVGRGADVRDQLTDTWVGPYEAVQALGTTDLPKGKVKPYASLIKANPGMSWEMLPDEALTQADTWEALLENGMPITALIRNLPRLTNLGLLQGSAGSLVASRLNDADLLRKGKVHPVKLLFALKTYGSGHSVKGTGTWQPVQKIVDALDSAFYTSFGTVEPAGKRTLLAMDVSGSMTWSSSGVISCAEGAVAMAMVTAATEPDYEIMGFSNQFRRLDVSPRRRLDDNISTAYNMTFGSTDCGLPMKWAADEGLKFDTFVVYTDNETYAGRAGHPHELLAAYRRKTGIDAKLIVVGMAASNFTIAAPDDPGMLDVEGFDADTPSVISGFSRGDFS